MAIPERRKLTKVEINWFYDNGKEDRRTYYCTPASEGQIRADKDTRVGNTWEVNVHVSKVYISVQEREAGSGQS